MDGERERRSAPLSLKAGLGAAATDSFPHLVGSTSRLAVENLADAIPIAYALKHPKSVDRIADYGFLIVDECHHVPARSFELVTSRAKARYVTGLTATITRKDGHHPIVFLHCGPIRHRAERSLQGVGASFSRRVIVRPTGFRAVGEPESDSRAESSVFAVS